MWQSFSTKKKKGKGGQGARSLAPAWATTKSFCGPLSVAFRNESRDWRPFSHRGARCLCWLLPHSLSLARAIRRVAKRWGISRRAAFPQTLTASARGEAAPRGHSTARGARPSRMARGNIFAPFGARVPILTCERKSHSHPTGPTPPRAHDVDSAPFFWGPDFNFPAFWRHCVARPPVRHRDDVLAPSRELNDLRTPSSC